MKDKQQWIERTWVTLLGLLIGIFFVLAAFSVYLGGLGVIRSRGEFILLQGMVRREVDQDIGLVFFSMSWLFLCALIASAVLTAAVYLRNGTLQLEKVFRGGRGTEIYPRLLLLALLTSALPILALVLRLLFSR